MSGKQIFFIMVIGVALLGFYLYSRSKQLDNETWRMTCTFPEVKGHIQTVGDYRGCMALHGLTPTDADIRRMCYYYSRDEYYLQTGKYPEDNTTAQNNLYLACIHEQGITE